MDGKPIDMPYLEKATLGNTGSPQVILYEGGTMGDLYINRELRTDGNGNIYVDPATNKVELTTTERRKVASLMPKGNIGWNNSFAWKGINLNVMLAARLGGSVVSNTEAFLDYYGVSERSAAARDAGGVRVNNGMVDAKNYYQTIGAGTGAGAYYIYDATNVRLQELSLAYTLPKRWFADKLSMTVSLVGRNLWMIYNKGALRSRTDHLDHQQLPAGRGLLHAAQPAEHRIHREVTILKPRPKMKTNRIFRRIGRLTAMGATLAAVACTGRLRRVQHQTPTVRRTRTSRATMSAWASSSRR